MPEIEEVKPTTPKAEDPFFAAMKGGDTWVKEFVTKLPEKGKSPLCAKGLVECIMGAYMDRAVSPAYSLSNVRKASGATYWYVQSEKERIRAPHVFAPMVHSRLVQQKMHFAATVGNLRTLLHSVVGVVMETLEAQATVGDNQIERDVHLYLEGQGGPTLRPNSVVLAPSSRKGGWEENILVVEEGNPDMRPKSLYTPGHLTLWCKGSNCKGLSKPWLEIDACHFKGPLFVWHDAFPYSAQQSVPVYEGMVQSRMVVQKYLSTLQPVLDAVVERVHAWISPQKKKKRRKKKKKRKKNLEPTKKTATPAKANDVSQVDASDKK